MKNLFNPYNPIMVFITKIVYTVWLNILWCICCIPVFTIGPATTALFYCCHRMADDMDGHITRDFFHSFKQNFKQATLIGISMTVLGIVLALDGYVLYHLAQTSRFWTILTAVFIVACITYILILLYIFPLLAYFENTTLSMFKNALLLSIRYLLCSILMLMIYFIMLLIIVRFYTPMIIFGMGTCAFLCSLLLKRIFKTLSGEINPLA